MEEWTELRLVWKLRGSESTSERVDDLDEAVRTVRLRERYEERRLADEEYELLAITRTREKGTASLWSDQSGFTLHAHVEAARRRGYYPVSARS